MIFLEDKYKDIFFIFNVPYCLQDKEQTPLHPSKVQLPVSLLSFDFTLYFFVPAILSSLQIPGISLYSPLVCVYPLLVLASLLSGIG